MKKTIVSLLLIFINLTAFAQQHVAGEVIVRLTDKTPVSDFLADFNKTEKSLGELTLKKAIIPEWDLYLCTFDAQKSDAASAAEILEEQRNVRYASLNRIAEERGTVPNDSQYEEQWNLDKIEVEKVWDITTGGTTVDGREIVAMVLDGGFDVNHVEVVDNLWINPGEILNGEDDDGDTLPDDIHGYNFRENTSVFTYQSNHGTAVSGILGAKGNNGTGMSGVNWDVKMMMCQAITDAQIYQSYYYARNARKLYNETDGAEGAFVVTSNASLGFSNDCDISFPIWNELLDSTGLVGIMNVGATVNGNLNIDVAGDTPTSCSSDYIITVTNTDITDQKVSSAGFGLETIDIGAPAGNSSSSTQTFTLSPENAYRSNFGGCSAASPHVAGVIALLYALPCDLIGEMSESDPAGLALLMKRSIIEGAEPNSSLDGITVSGGRLNAYRSMLWWQSYCANPSEERIDVDEYINNFVAETALTNAYPNPADDFATFDYSIDDYGDFEVKVYDVLGRLVYNGSETAEAFRKQSFTINTHSWAEGMYFVTIPNGKKTEAIPLVVIH